MEEYTTMTSSPVITTTDGSNASNVTPDAFILVPPPCRDLLYATIGPS